MEPVAPALKPPDFSKELFPDTNFLASAIITQRLIFADFSCSTTCIEHLIFISLRWSYTLYGWIKHLCSVMFLTTHIIEMFPNSVNIMGSLVMQCLNSNLNFII